MYRILIFLFLLANTCMASTVTTPFVYSTNDTVTNVKLNSNQNAVTNVVNGGLDNTNANTASGYRFFQKVGVLPSPGNQGAVYYLTTDNTLNFDTGSTFIKSISVIATPARGDVIYYDGTKWADLNAGILGQNLQTQGIGANPVWGNGFFIPSSVQGDISYYSGSIWTRLGAGPSGEVLETQGAGANPQWASSVSVVVDYGTSTSSSTSRQGTSMKIAYGQTGSISGSSSVNITNLPFSSGTSYTVTTGQYTQFNCGVSSKSGSQFTITNTHNDSVGGNGNCDWMAVGT